MNFMKWYNDPEVDKKEEKLFLILIAIMAAVLLAIAATKMQAQTRSRAQIDTVMCDINCIKNYIVDDRQAKPKISVVYIDSIYDIQEVIPMSMSVYEYICNCKQYGIRPSLGIKLRNGQIVSIVKYKNTYIRRRRL